MCVLMSAIDRIRQQMAAWNPRKWQRQIKMCILFSIWEKDTKKHFKSIYVHAIGIITPFMVKSLNSNNKRFWTLETICWNRLENRNDNGGGGGNVGCCVNRSKRGLKQALRSCLVVSIYWRQLSKKRPFK